MGCRAGRNGTYHRLVEFMNSLVRHPLAPLGWGTATSLVAGIAIFGFGAPAWVLVPLAYGGLTLYAVADLWLRRHGRHSYRA